MGISWSPLCSSVLAWRIPGTGEPGGLPSMGRNQSRSIVSHSLQPHGLYSPWNSPGQKTGVGSLSLLQGIFPTQGLNPGLPHCRHPGKFPKVPGRGKDSACNAEDLGSTPGLGRFPGEGQGYPLQFSGLENSIQLSLEGSELALQTLHPRRDILIVLLLENVRSD